MIVLNDPETKVPIAIMDGTLISTIRTGAVTGVCAKYMAPSRSKTVGLYDVAIAARVYQYAKENGIGQKLKLWDEPIMV